MRHAYWWRMRVCVCVYVIAQRMPGLHVRDSEKYSSVDTTKTWHTRGCRSDSNCFVKSAIRATPTKARWSRGIRVFRSPKLWFLMNNRLLRESGRALQICLQSFIRVITFQKVTHITYFINNDYKMLYYYIYISFTHVLLYYFSSKMTVVFFSSLLRHISVKMLPEILETNLLI